MTIKTPRLRQNRHGVFCFRLLYTDADGQRREAVRSLGTKDAETARVIALRLNADHEQRRQMTRRFPNPADLVDPLKVTTPDGLTFDGETAEVLEAVKRYKAENGVFPPLQEQMAYGRTLHAFTPPNAPTPLKTRSKPYAEAVALYLADKEGENSPQTLKEKGRVFETVRLFFDDDNLTLAGLDKERAQLWKAHLKAKGNSLKTVNHRLGTLHDFYAWAIDHGHATSNPFDGLKSKARTANDKGDNYAPFTEDDLKRIFSPAPYLAKFNHRPDFYWLPLLALFSGARLGELAGLKSADIQTIDGVQVMAVQRRKTKASRRLLPIHPTLIDFGFLDYAEAVRATGETDLFPMKATVKKGGSLGNAFAEYLDALGITDPLKVFHSFRHSVISQLAGEGAHGAHSRVIAGHAKGDVHDTVYTHLQHGEGLRKLAGTVATLAYPFLDLDALRLTDATFSPYLKDWQAGANHRARLAASKVKNAQAKAARKKPFSPTPP